MSEGKVVLHRWQPYHVGEWNEIEEAIAVRMGAEQYPSVGFGKYCREVLWATWRACRLEVTHHPAGSSTGFYRMTTLDRDGQWSALAAKDATKGIPKSEVLFRSHHHFFGVVEHASKLIVQLPCWSCRTGIAGRVGCTASTRISVAY